MPATPGSRRPGSRGLAPLAWRALCVLLVVAPVYDVKVRVPLVTLHPSGILLLMTALLVGVGWARGQLRRPLRGVDLVGLGFLLWFLIRALQVGGGAAIKRVIALGMVGLAYLVGSLLVRGAARREAFSRWILVSGILASIGAYFLRVAGGRAVGNFGNPNSLGMYLAGCIPLAAAYLMSRPDRTSLRRQWVWLGILAMVAGLYLSGSRGALVGTVAGLALVLTRRMDRALWGLALGSFVAFASLAFEGGASLGSLPRAIMNAGKTIEVSKYWLAYNGFIEASFTEAPFVDPEVFTEIPQSLGARLMIWVQASRAAAAHPFLGIGPGQSYFSGVPFDSKAFTTCFNVHLLVLVETGLVGILFHTAWLYLILRQLLDGLRRARSESDRMFGVGLMGSLGALFVHGLIEDSYFTIYANWLIGLLVGAAAAMSARAPDAADAPRALDTSAPRFEAAGSPWAGSGRMDPGPPGPREEPWP